MPHAKRTRQGAIMKSSNGKKIETRGYAPVNGLKMYYEIEGTGEPLVYIPPAFGYAGVNEFPTLRRNRQVITMDLQGHGRTADIPERPITFDQHAQGVIGLLEVFSLQCPGFSKEELASIQAPFLIIQGDNDFVRIEHSVE